MSYLETDAVIEDGQSGGLLLDAVGNAIGVTGSSRGRFALALSIEDVRDRVGGLLGGRDVDGLGDRLIGTAPRDAPRHVEVDLQHRADNPVWPLAAASGDPAGTIEMTADPPAHLKVHAAGGALAHGTGGPVRAAKLDLDFRAPAPFLVLVDAPTPSHVELTCSVGLVALEDPDDGHPIRIGETYHGAADRIGDLDWLTLDLQEGETITISVRSLGFDPALFLEVPGQAAQPLRGQADVGGVLGWDDEARYEARQAGTYLIVVADLRNMGTGAYAVTVT